jgi:hypothetical protein
MNGKSRMQQPPPSSTPDAEQAAMLRQWIMGFRMTQMIYVAARLGLADELRVGPQPVQQLAQAVQADAQSLYRLLRALAGLGLFVEIAEHTFALTPLGHLLCSDTPGSLHSVALLYGSEWLWQAYGQMLYSVQTGGQAFAHVHGEDLFAYLHSHPAAAAQFHAAMSGFSALEASAILAAYDFSACTEIVDVGGGQGTLLAAILHSHPQATGVLFDLPPVAEAAKFELAKAGLSERTSCIGGSFFEAIPSGGDAYLVKSVLHNWRDADCIAILRRCRQAMDEGARLLIIERIVPEGNQPAEAKLFDINMLVVVGGQERTEREYRHLLEASGFVVQEVTATQSPLSIIEASPVAAL